MGFRGVFVCALVLCSFVVIDCDEAARRAVVEGNNGFSLALYQALSSQSGNLVMSPLSVQAVMAMVWLGAGGETATQLSSGLQLPSSRSQVETGFDSLLSSLQSTNYVTLEIANKMYLQEGSGVKDSYRQTATDYFQSSAEEVDFSNNTEAVRTSINQWVEQKTHNKIQNLIEEGSLSPATLMVIVNAIYFKGGWREPFYEHSTRPELFHLTSTSSVNVSMMYQMDTFKYAAIPELNATALQMFYRGNTDDLLGNDLTQSMLIILPNEVDGLASLEANIGSINLTNIISKLYPVETRVSLPRFKVESKLKLKDTLMTLGITSVFAPGADLSGITDDGVYVNKVIQKAFVEVTEKGTEAAAATFADIVFLSAPSVIREFNADHPFLFLILDDHTGTILFMGRVAHPTP